MEIEIIIVSHKRAGGVTTCEAVADTLICVPASQEQDYLRYHDKDQLVIHPDHVVGLPAKRQWILDNFGDVFMLDDDLKEMRAVHREAGVAQKVDRQTAKAIIQQTSDAARQAGVHLFGFNQSCIPTAYSGFKPISLSGFLIEGWIGFLKGGKLFYPRDLKLCGDFWISCLNAYYHRKIWRDNRFSFMALDTFKNQGGQSEFRNMEAEREAYEYLIRHFGSEVVQLKRNTHLAKRKHQYQKSLNLPF